MNTENNSHFEPNHQSEASSSSGEQQAKQLQLLGMAQKLGIDGEPTSIAELADRASALVLQRRQVAIGVVNQAHDMSLVSDTFSSVVIDTFRAILQTSQDESTEKPFYDKVKDYDSSFSTPGYGVLEHWEDVKFLLGIDDASSVDTVASLERARSRAFNQGNHGAELPYSPRVNSGSVAYESQETGAWGNQFTW